MAPDADEGSTRGSKTIRLPSSPAHYSRGGYLKKRAPTRAPKTFRSTSSIQTPTETATSGYRSKKKGYTSTAVTSEYSQFSSNVSSAKAPPQVPDKKAFYLFEQSPNGKYKRHTLPDEYGDQMLQFYEYERARDARKA